jgi:uncharacterized protein YhjY with autotransporter beta-barrel domain
MFYFLQHRLTKRQMQGSPFELKRNKLSHEILRHLDISFTTIGVLAAVSGWQSAEAQTFNQASNAELQSICTGVITSSLNYGDFGPLTPTNNHVGAALTSKCLQMNVNGQAVTASSGGGTFSQPSSFLISQQQLQNAQTLKLTQQKPAGAADSVTTNWGENFSTFLTAGATALHHRNNDYEQGYNASVPSVTLGGNYLIASNLEAGLAFNYANSNASYTTGGGFNTNSYTPLLFVNYLPFDNAFANLSLGYTRQNQTTNRIAVAGINTTGSAITGSTQANLNANQFNLNFLSGYDFALQNITVGPRLGLNTRQWEMNSYQETTNTGLELRYNNQYQTSVQSTFGLFASSAHSYSFGVLIPQITASWVHEYDNNSRTVNAQFVQAAPGTGNFSFQTETPARNWAAVDLGVSLVLPKGMQAFANLSTVQGNRNFESYGGSLGLRIGW